MITVSDLISKLQIYAGQSPENGSAEVLLRFDTDLCLQFSHATDARSPFEGQHCLILEPDDAGAKIRIREMSIQ